MTVAVLFPGQGSQFVGMGVDLFAQRPDLLGDAADEILGWSLREVCLRGPEERLTRTEFGQPALFAVSYALWLSFRDVYSGHVAGAAGHSLGEYTALCAADSIDYADTLQAVSYRGQAMAAAADEEPSGMAALIGADLELVEDVVSQRREMGGRLEVANLNAPGQIVVAGADEDIEWVVDNARDLGIRRAIPLKVAGAFHSSFMKSAASDIAETLSDVRFREPEFPIWSNTTAQPHETSEISSTLIDQVFSTVRFDESLRAMGEYGIDTFIHVGPGEVTAGMAKRSVPGASVHTISRLTDIPDVVESLVTMA